MLVSWLWHIVNNDLHLRKKTSFKSYITCTIKCCVVWKRDVWRRDNLIGSPGVSLVFWKYEKNFKKAFKHLDIFYGGWIEKHGQGLYRMRKHGGIVVWTEIRFITMSLWIFKAFLVFQNLFYKQLPSELWRQYGIGGVRREVEARLSSYPTSGPPCVSPEPLIPHLEKWK